jgi:2',3'-cyclic-nucleotide 2'-phosphodiesterase (5'-nucleotidase family)
MGLHAMTAHWDFAYGPARLKELTSQLPYPLLAINVYVKDTGERFFEPYTIQEVAGLKIGIIGIACPVVAISMPASFRTGLRFTFGNEELPGFITEVRGKGADLVVVLSHLGFPQDMWLLSEVPGVDVLLSGHTHDRLYEPVIQNGAIVIQSGCQGSFLGRLDLEVENGKVKSHKHELIVVEESIKPDATMEALVKKAMEPYAAELARVVGEVNNSLDRDASLESTMDNFLLDAVRELAGTQLGFSNGWRWGAPIPAGKLTMKDLYDIVPMLEPISTVDLTGAELKVMLEENLQDLFGPAADQEGGYIKRCMGMTMYVRANNPNGHRVTQLIVGDEVVQPDKVYSAAFITVQGVPSKFGRNRKDLPSTPQDAMLAYLNKHQPARAEIRGSVVAF